MPPKGAPRLTHFLCIPLLTPASTPQLRTSLLTFKGSITSENPDGLLEKAVRPLGTLHLMLGVMSLLTDEKVQSALNVLKGLDLKGMWTAPGASSTSEGGVSEKEKGGDVESELRITLRGLESMHTPTSTSVLYAPPIPSPPLTSLCQFLKQAFLDAELLIPDTRSLLLHATVLNTIYVPGVRSKGGRSNTGHGKHKAKLTINAEELIQDYEDFIWMKDVKVERVAICRMGAEKLTEEDDKDELGERYFEEGFIEMP